MPSPIGHALAAIAAGCLVAPPRAWVAAVTPDAPRRADGPKLAPLPSGVPARWAPAAAFRARVQALAASVAPLGIPLLVLAATGLLADVDLVAGVHSGPTHSLGAAAVLGAIVASGRWPDRRRVALAVFAAYASHVLLDWLSEDTSVPIGVMALWPFNDAHWHAPFSLFFATDRRYWLDGFWWRNLQTLAWELLIFVPAATMILKRWLADPGSSPPDRISKPANPA